MAAEEGLDSAKKKRMPRRRAAEQRFTDGIMGKAALVEGEKRRIGDKHYIYGYTNLKGWLLHEKGPMAVLRG